MATKKLKIEQVNIADLSSDPANARKHGEKNHDAIVASLRRFGQVKPIVVDSSNVVRAGNGTLEAARLLGWETINVVRTDLKGSEATAYAIADNRTAELAEWDDETLAATLQGLVTDDEELLAACGFDEDELAELLADFDLDGDGTTGEIEEDKVPEPPEDPITKPGDLWMLGRHRLLCGDSTKAEDVGRLMDGAKAEMVFTDPPYNISFSGTMSSTSVGGVTVPYITENAKHEEIANDKKSAKDFQDFIARVLCRIKEHTKGGWYICFCSGNIDELLNPLIQEKMRWKSILIWNKNQSPMGGGHYRRKYEPIAYGYFGNIFYGREYAEDDVWDIDRTHKNDLHPTMKPVALAAKALEKSSKVGDVVLDLFLGSGTTLIAAEQLGRTCYGMEISPAYCDVIVKRWENLTGEKAKLA